MGKRLDKRGRIDEIHGDGVPYRPVRQHFGIASFGVSSFTGRKSGDRIINPLYEAGAYAEAADRAREAIEAFPEAAGAFFCLAACEVLAGRADDAARHLRHALERSERLRGLARRNSDFDAIRDRPEIAELLAG
jgi:tetratricopeptide (TPR) repeat protein